MASKQLSLVLATAAALFSACTGSNAQPEPAPAEPAQVSSAQASNRPPPTDLAAGQAEFGVDMYRRIGAEPGNVFLSPISISTALGMVYAGAEGVTAAEMAQALRLPAGEGVHEDIGDLLRRLPIDSEGRVLRVANALWVQRDFQLQPQYLALVAKHYGGNASPVDFVDAPDQSIATINGWAEEKTAGRIKGLLTRANINSDTRLILTNSVYFKGDWLHPFKANQTRQRPFQMPGGRSIPATFMRQRGPFKVLTQDGFQVLEAPYKGEELSMLLFVPNEPDGLGRFEQALTGEKLESWIRGVRAVQPGDVELVMPKIEMTTKASLVPELQALGMRRAFTNGAELGGIASPARLRLSDVIHQTFLLVDEKGTEAAAVTGAIAEIVSMPMQFHADRPFFFLIRDNRSNMTLFMGRISDPGSIQG